MSSISSAVLLDFFVVVIADMLQADARAYLPNTHPARGARPANLVFSNNVGL